VRWAQIDLLTYILTYVYNSVSEESLTAHILYAVSALMANKDYYYVCHTK